LFDSTSSPTSSVQCDQPIHDEHEILRTHTLSDSSSITYFNDAIVVPRTTASDNACPAVADDVMTMQHLMLSCYIMKIRQILLIHCLQDVFVDVMLGLLMKHLCLHLCL
jgi:hypothetical protein